MTFVPKNLVHVYFKGKNPKVEHLLTLAVVGDIKKTKAMDIIDHVHVAVNKWKACAASAGVSPPQAKRIGEALEGIKRDLKK